MLDVSVMKQNNEVYQKRLNTLQKNLLLRAASDRNFLSNPKEVGKMISNTMYAEDGRNISDVLMVSLLKDKSDFCRSLLQLREIDKFAVDNLQQAIKIDNLKQVRAWSFWLCKRSGGFTCYVPECFTNNKRNQDSGHLELLISQFPAISQAITTATKITRAPYGL